jgi:hypothetical protein
LEAAKIFGVFTSVGQFFEVLKNHQLQFFKYFRIKESPIPVFHKFTTIQNQRTVDSCHFKNLKELTGFAKEPAVLWLVL